MGGRVGNGVMDCLAAVVGRSLKPLLRSKRLGTAVAHILLPTDELSATIFFHPQTRRLAFTAIGKDWVNI